MGTPLGIGVVVLLIAGFVAFLIKMYNRLIFMRANTEKAFANIDVLLKQRFDEIPNLVTVVQQYAEHEKETLEKMTKLRTNYSNQTASEEKVKTSNDFEKSLREVFLNVENYPDLKANESYMALQSRMSELEDHIADRREFFNESVNIYNIGIAKIPDVFLSSLMGYKRKEMLIMMSDI